MQSGVYYTMARKIVDIGVTGNDATGDSIRESFRKVNDNFQEIYAIFGVGGQISFTTLSDTPDTLVGQNGNIPIVNVDGTALDLRSIVGNRVNIDVAAKYIQYDTIEGGVFSIGQIITGTTSGATATIKFIQISLKRVYFTSINGRAYQDTENVVSGGTIARNIVNGSSILFENNESRLLDDPTPILQSALNASGNIIGNLGEPSPDVVGEFNSLYGVNATTIDNLAIPKGYADQRYLLKGFEKAIAAISRSSPVTIRTVENHRLDRGDQVFINNLIGSVELEGRLFYVDPTDSDEFALYTDAELTLPEDGTSHSVFQGGGRVTFKTKDFISNPVEVPAGATGAEIPQVQEVITRGGSIENRTMEAALFLHDHPGALSGAGSPTGVDDLQAATKYYVDNSSYASTINLYVSTDGDDAQLRTPSGKEGRAPGYAFKSINRAAQKAEEIIRDSLTETGPYRQAIAYGGGAEFSEISAVVPNNDGTGTIRVFFTNNGGARVDQGNAGNTDILPGKLVVGRTSGAKGTIYLYYGAATDPGRVGNDFFDLIPISGMFTPGENLEYGEPVAETNVSIIIESGTYYEDFPIRLAVNVSLFGDEFRRVLIRPAPRPSQSPWARIWFFRDTVFDGLTIAATNYGYHYLTDPYDPNSEAKNNTELDVFLMNDATIVRQVTCQGHGGFMMVLDPEGQIQTKSPYFQQGSSFSGSLNKQRFAGGQYVDGFSGNLPATILETIETDGEIKDLVVSYTQRPVQTPTSFVVQGSQFRVNTFRPDGSGNADASALLKFNRDFIAAETIGYINNELLFVYDQNQFLVNTRNIVDAVANDVLRGGNQQSRTIGLSYWDNLTSLIEGQIPQTISALEHLKDILPFVISNNLVLLPYQTDVSQVPSSAPILSAGNNLAVTRSNIAFDEVIDILLNGNDSADTLLFPTPSSATVNRENAKNQLRANRSFLQAEVVAFVEDSGPPPGIDINICSRDTGYIVDALSYDILYGGNSASRGAASAYFDGTSAIIGTPTEVASTVAAYEHLTSVIINVVQGIAVTPTVGNTEVQDTDGDAATSAEAGVLDGLIQIIQDVIIAGTILGMPAAVFPSLTFADPDILSARTSLIANKNNIIDSTIEYIENAFDYLVGTYDETKCRRDTGLIIDAVSYDLVLGTNYNSVTAGQAYSRATTDYLKAEQKTETARAIAHAKAKAASYMLFVSQGGSDTSVINRIESLIDLIIEIISLTPFNLAAVPTVEFNNVPSTDLDLVAAHTAFTLNRDFLARETVGLINDKYFVSYNEEKCQRDTRLIVDALVHDILYTGNLKIAEAANTYLLPSSNYVLSRYQNNETVLALEYAKQISNLVIANTVITSGNLYQTAIPQFRNTDLNSGSTAAVRVTELVDIVKGAITNGKIYKESREIAEAGKAAIQDSVINFLSTTYSVTITASSAADDAFTCSSTANLRVNFPIKFADDNSTAVFGGVDAVDTVYYILDIPVSGKFRIKTSLESTVPVQLTNGSGLMTGTLAYNEDTCRRDTGIIVNAIANDFVGGNLQATRAGFRYRAGTAFVVIEEQAVETIAAINHLRDQMRLLFPAGAEPNDTLRTKITNSALIITNIITDVELAPENIYPKYQLVLDDSTPFYQPLTATNVTLATVTDDNEILCSVSNTSIVGGDLLKGLQVSGENLPNGAFVSFVNAGPSTTSFIIRLRREVDYTGTSTGSLTFSPPEELTLLTPGNASMCSNDFTQINDLGYGLIATNIGLIEAVSVFTYYCHTAYYANNGGQIRSLNGSTAQGEFGLVSEGSDPLEIPDDVVLDQDMIQTARIYKRGTYASDNIEEDAAVYVTNFDYVPFNTSEVEIIHPGLGVVRYEMSNAEDVSVDTNILISSFTSKTGSGPYTVTYQIPSTSPVPTTNINYTIIGNSNLNYNGTFLCTASSATSISVRYPTDPGTYGTGNTRIYPTLSLLKLNLGTGGNNDTSTTGLKADLLDNQLVTIRGNQNFNFREILETSPTRPSTALTFTGDPQSDPVYRVIAYDNVGPIPGQLLADQAVLTFDVSFKYVKLIVDSSNGQTVDPSNGSKTLGSKVGDVKIAVSALDEADSARINTGEMIIGWYGKKHRVTEYVPSLSYNYVSIVDTDLDGNSYVNKNISGAVATGLQEPVIPGNGFVVTGFTSTTGVGPFLVTFAISEQSIAPATGVNYTVVRSGTTAYNGNFSCTASSLTSITLSYPSDPGVYAEGSTDTVIFLTSQKFNTDLLIGETPTIRAGLSDGESAEVVVKISTVRATGHDFLDIGTGGYNNTNYPSKIYGPPREPDQSKEVAERTRGRVFYASTDQDGFFRVGRFFTVDQGTGTVTFAASIALSNLDGIGFKRGVTVAEFSNDDSMIDRATDTVPTEAAVAGYIDRRLGVDIDGNRPDNARLLGDARLRFLDDSNINKPVADFNVNGFRVTNIPLLPVANNEAASKNYVDTQDLSNVRVDTNTVAKAANNLLVWNSLNSKWVNAETATTGDINAVLNTGTQALALNIKDGAIINTDVNASAAIAQSKLAMTAASTRANATGIAQTDLGLASFKASEFTATNGWIELQTASSASTGTLLSKLQHINNGFVLGNRSGSAASPQQITPGDVVLDGDGIKNARFTSSSGDLVFLKTGADAIGGAMTIVLNDKEVCRGSSASWSAVGSAVTSLTIALPSTSISGIGSIDAGQRVARISGTGAIPPNSTVTSYNTATNTLVINWPIAQTVTLGSGIVLSFTASGPDYSITNITTAGAAHSLIKTDGEGAITLGSLKIDGFLVADTSGSNINFYTPGGGATGLNANFLTASGTSANISVKSFGSFTAEVDDAVNNAVTYALTATHLTTGTPAIGIGSGIRFITETATANNTEIGSTIESISTTVAAASEAFDLVFKTMSGGATATEKVRISSIGNVTIQGDLDVRGGDITTNQTTFSLIDAIATTVNFAGAAITGNFGYDGSLSSTTNISVGATASGQTKIVNIATDAGAGSTTNVVIGSTVGGTLTVNNTTVSIVSTSAATSSTTGALRVGGGVGVGGSLYVAGAVASSSTITGTVVVTGGVGISGDIYAGGIQNTAIGGTTRNTGAFTTLGANSTTTLTGAVSINGANVNTVISPTGTGTVTISPAGALTINPTTASTINNTSIGASTRSTGAFTTLTSNAATTFTQNTASSSTTSGTLVVTGGTGISENLYVGGIGSFASGIQNTAVGNTTRSTGAFTTLTSNGATTFTAGTASTTTATGTLVVTGGVGVSGRINAPNFDGAVGANTRSTGAFTTLTSNGATTFTAGTASTTTTTGTLVVTGGVGVSGSVFAAGFNGPLTGNASSITGQANSATITATSANTANQIVLRDASGNFSAGVMTGTATNARYADLAENYLADFAYPAGTVLEFGGEFEVTLAEDDTRKVAGIVSTNPAHLMNTDLTGDTVVALALQGRVPCKVRGKIRKGDMLISGGSGYARPTTDPKLGAVIGKALEDFDGIEGVIEVVVGRL